MKLSKHQELLKIREQARAAARWRAWVRRLAILRIRWTRISTDQSLADNDREQRLQVIEIQQRSVKAAVWKSIPEARRFSGTGKDKHQVPADIDRWRAIGKLGSDVANLLDRRHAAQDGPSPSSVSPGGEKRFGPFDVELDDLADILSNPIEPQLATIARKSQRMNQPQTYSPNGQPVVPQQPGIPPIPVAPPIPTTSPGRAQPPPTPPMDLAVAEAFEIPFGKYKGMTIGWLLGDREGVSYLHWLCTKAEIKSPRFSEALSVVFHEYEGELVKGVVPDPH